MGKADIDKYNLLPTCAGPQLRRFRRHKLIEYVEVLNVSYDSVDGNASSDSVHGYVFKVLIDKTPYALKVFKFFDPEVVRGRLLQQENNRISDEDLVGQKDPFYAECRAYGAIDASGRKRSPAVPCYGFLSIPAKKQIYFKKQFGIDDWERLEKDALKPVSRRTPFRALVKDLVESDPPPSHCLFRRQLDDLKSLHELGVYVMDVKAENYKGGRICDLSSSRTEPHYMLSEQIRPLWDIELQKSQDFADFDDMVEESGVKTSLRALRNKATLNKLRPRQKGAINKSGRR